MDNNFPMLARSRRLPLALSALAFLALVAGCGDHSREDFAGRMRMVVRIFSEFEDERVNELIADQVLRPPGGQSGRAVAAQAKRDYLRVRGDVQGRAMASPVPATGEIAQPLHTAPVPADPAGLWLIPYLALHKGNVPVVTGLERPTPVRAILVTAVEFRFEQIEYRRYPNGTAVPLPVKPLGTLAAFQTGLAIVPPRTVPKRITLRWEFMREGERWRLARLGADEKSIEWVVDNRTL